MVESLFDSFGGFIVANMEIVVIWGYFRWRRVGIPIIDIAGGQIGDSASKTFDTGAFVYIEEEDGVDTGIFGFEVFIAVGDLTNPSRVGIQEKTREFTPVFVHVLIEEFVDSLIGEELASVEIVFDEAPFCSGGLSFFADNLAHFNIPELVVFDQ